MQFLVAIVSIDVRSEAELNEQVVTYLTARAESPSIVNQTLEILHPRVVQKSYQAEKRCASTPFN